VKQEIAQISMCEEVDLGKELKKGSEVMVAHVMLMQLVEDNSNLLPETLQHTLAKFKVVFDESKGLPPIRSADHKIILKPNSIPVNQRPYRYSHYQKLELDKIIEELLKNGVIQPSTSPYSSPALLVKKKDGS
jgi:hypothetical protein